MTWDPRAERIEAKGRAERDAAEAEAIRAQTARENRAAARQERAEERAERERRRAERRKRRADRRRALAAGIGRYGVPLVAIGSPEVIAWSGQMEFAQHTMHLGVLSPLLPVALEGGTLYSARLALVAIDDGKPAGRYRLATWVQAMVAAGMNYWHGSAGAGGPQVGVALGLTSLLGIVMLELTVALRRHKAGARTGEQIRAALVRRLRYPLLSAKAAALAAARGLDAEEAWRAAWIDRYGLGPDSTRRERRTARAILARQRRIDREAAKAGHLAIVDGRIVRPAPEPLELTLAERQAEAFATLFGLDLSDEALAAWLNEPPAGGSLTARTSPDEDGPEGGARAAGELAQISGDLGDRGREPADDDRLKASEARRARGEQTRARVAAYMAAHPDASIAQIAAALGMSPATVKRHRAAIRQEGE